MTIDAAHELQSIGHLANQLQISTRAIEAIVPTLSLSGVWKLDGVLHFDAPSVETIIAELARRNVSGGAAGSGRRNAMSSANQAVELQDQWNAALETEKAKIPANSPGRDTKAAAAADKKHPGLRQRLVEATNAAAVGRLRA